MSLAVAIQMDPIEDVDIDADSTFVLALEAQRRGHALYHYLPQDLMFHHGRVLARARRLTVRREKVAAKKPWLPLLAVTITGAALIYGTLDMPNYGDPEAPIQKHVAPRYIERAMAETNVPNMVTAVLASYRGYDTLGEVTVIFTAGVGVLLLLTHGGRRRREDEEDAP